MKFSQRQGITPASKPIQIDSMDDDLRNGLWNGIKIHIIDPQSRYKGDRYSSADTQFYLPCELIWHQYFRLTIDSIPEGDYARESHKAKIL
jgi:hypothetical protein